MLCGINLPFGRLFPSIRQVAHVLLTRPPLGSSPKGISSLDLHVLGTPPAFVLSQDQTLNKKFNLLLKLLWVLILRLKRIAGLFYLTLFCSIFKDHFLCRPQATSIYYHLEFLLSTFIFHFPWHRFPRTLTIVSQLKINECTSTLFILNYVYIT